MASNPAGASWLQALRPERRVAELGSLIWLKIVKQAFGLRSEILFHFPVTLTAASLNSEAGTLSPAVINAEIRESTGRCLHTARSYQQVTVRRGACFSLGTRFGFPSSIVCEGGGYRLKRPSRVAPDRVPASGSKKARGQCHRGGLWVWVCWFCVCLPAQGEYGSTTAAPSIRARRGERRRRSDELQFASPPVATA